MTYFELRVTGGNKSVEILDNGKNNLIDEVSVEMDTVDDNSRVKSNSMIARVYVKGSITKSVNAQLKEIFDWSKDFRNDTTYRKVEITIKDDETTELKTFSFDKMFVRDYKEHYVSKGDSDKGGTFEIWLSQQERNFDSAEVFLP